MNQPLRWQQRFSNYKRALAKLTNAIELSTQRKLSDLEKQGLIQAFEFTHELAWNVMRDYFVYQGNMDISGSRDAVRESFKAGLVTDGDGWMEMIKSRNMTSHTYNEKVAEEIVQFITKTYHTLFVQFKEKMDKLSAKNE